MDFIGEFFDWFEEHSLGILVFILALVGLGVLALLFSSIVVVVGGVS